MGSGLWIQQILQASERQKVLWLPGSVDGQEHKWLRSHTEEACPGVVMNSSQSLWKAACKLEGWKLILTNCQFLAEFSGKNLRNMCCGDCVIFQPQVFLIFIWWRLLIQLLGEFFWSYLLASYFSVFVWGRKAPGWLVTSGAEKKKWLIMLFLFSWWLNVSSDHSVKFLHNLLILQYL